MSCESSAKQMIHMECQALFSLKKKKKKKSKCLLLQLWLALVMHIVNVHFSRHIHYSYSVARLKFMTCRWPANREMDTFSGETKSKSFASLLKSGLFLKERTCFPLGKQISFYSRSFSEGAWYGAKQAEITKVVSLRASKISSAGVGGLGSTNVSNPLNLACSRQISRWNEPGQDKTYNMTCVTSKDSYQLVHLSSMARVFIYPSFDSPEDVDGTWDQQRLGSDCADVIWVFTCLTSLILGFDMHWLEY